MCCWSVATKEVNHARGVHVAISRNRAHFYFYATKVGTLWFFTNYRPVVAYEVNPHWRWCSLGKLSNEMYSTHLLTCRRLQNNEAVAEKLQSTSLLFRTADGPPLAAHLHKLFLFAVLAFALRV